MKKINVLKPDVQTAYLNFGKGQEVTYLNVPDRLTVKDLEEDVKNGAVHLKEAAKLLKKKPSRFVMIKCSSREEGLLAVTYLSSIYNAIDGLDYDQYCTGEWGSDMLDESTRDYSDFEDFTSDETDDEEDDGEIGESWEENPWKIPIVPYEQLGSQDFSYVFGNNYGFSAEHNRRNQIPYWTTTRSENICIVYTVRGFASLEKSPFKRFSKNRHVFFLVVDPFSTVSSDDETSKEYTEDEDPFGMDPFGMGFETMLTYVVLEYSAEVISLAHGKNDLRNYYDVLFENWIEKTGYRLTPNFPTHKVVGNMLKISDDSYCEMIEKIIMYVVKDINKDREIVPDDFAVLNRLQGISIILNAPEHKNIKKLENSLIGMDEVKDRIQAMVDVMKYQKRRQKMGFNNGGFHNVYMLLGAPGTAKSTVAEIVGNIMAEERLLQSNRFISVNGAELKGMFVGHSAPKVKALFDEHDIIFIDEAYSISSSTDGRVDSFSQEAIAQLILELEKHGMDRLVMFAGYGGTKVDAKDNRMKDFLNSNPGIRSRINATICFDSYTADQMVDIFRGQAKNSQYRVSKAADKYVREFFKSRVDAPDFGNGREARSLLENTTVMAARRIAKIPEKEITKSMLQELSVDDVRGAIQLLKEAEINQRGKDSGRLGF